MLFRYYVDFGPASADQVHSSDDSEVDLVKQKSQSPEGSAVEKRISSDEEQANEPPTGSESATEDDSDAPDSEREGLQAVSFIISSDPIVELTGRKYSLKHSSEIWAAALRSQTKLTTI